MKDLRTALIDRLCALPGSAEREYYEELSPIDLLDDYEELLRLMWEDESGLS